MKLKSFDGLDIAFIVGFVFTLLVIILSVVFLAKCSNRVSERIKSEDKPIFQMIGEGIKKIETDFNKGYSNGNR